ncbi:hypothetical protein DCC39_00430 [Pueribacillus theae]|uniref:endopeptidase La n=1 Tax=Pueribacillus theae TaxID=2171751 RepID=A0A2U1K7M9_9BACI|nr:SepM family pheromone-processing serine protease [Pueribacillus theae]PWA13392.1 hypothetical protein DCC39_00430 [Pueribacillus theae]
MRFTKKHPYKSRTYAIFAVVVAIILLTVIKLPFYVTYPGDAESLDNMVTVEGGNSETGELMLTTIRIGKANILQYAIAHFNKYQYIFPENQIKREWESDSEYDHRQLKVMEMSQQAAIITAFKLAGEQVEIKNEGVIVTGLIEGMPAEKKLAVGDIIQSVDGKKIETSEELLAYLKEKKEGETVTFDINRNGKMIAAEVKVQQFPKDYGLAGENKVGVGIVGPVTKRVVNTERKVTFNTNSIGGPSAGLMFTLEIYNQLTDKDLTKGYKIAGTGEINENGDVGAIGGIKQKVVAADNADADFFFAPVDGNNFKEAEEAAEEIKTKMKIIPVKTAQEAIDYLSNL